NSVRHYLRGELAMLRVLSIILTLLALAPAAQPGGKSEAAVPSEQLKVLLAEYEVRLKVYEAVREAYRKAINDDDNPKKVWTQLLKVRATFRQQRDECAAGCLKLAAKHPDAPAALDALFWVVRNTLTGNPGRPENASLVRLNHQAFDLLRRDHIES